MLSADQLIDLEIRVRERIDALEQAEASEGVQKETEAVAPDRAIGRISRMDSMQMQQMTLAARRRRQEEIEGLKRALVRMDEGAFGLCSVCRQWIEPARLEAAPERTTCQACASRQGN